MSTTTYEVVHRERRRDYTIEIVQDEDCIDPRDGDAYGTLVGFDLEMNGADIYVDTEDRFECRYCTAGMTPDGPCEHCDSFGWYTPTCVDEWVMALGVDYDIAFIRPVLHDSHGPVSRYWLDTPSPAWQQRHMMDSRIVGFLIYEREHINQWFTLLAPPTPEALLSNMECEIAEFTDWANGACYGYRIVDDTGEVFGDMWGWIGDYDGLLDEARAEVDGMEPAHPMCKVWLTAWEISALQTGIADHPDLGSVRNKLTQALPAERE